ncbi:MFS transporter [Microbacterium sp. ASV49]|uniref:MFS transporter n=1 Tax=Microbacterium candidum TaxID=3041922 RepID=A0ABT7MU50_9MICO|nr:MFS transporter [Microbacterium sp. ASV49]MDL9977969.1 MFS transporter [Microbacterium sp. ASV49]
MSDTTQPAGIQQSAAPATSAGAPKIIGGARFVVTFFLANAGMYAIFQGMQQIVLPTQIAAIDPSGKVAAYGILASIGAAAAAIGNPVFGALSDRTRSRFGRRAPWLLISAIVALVLLAILGGMTSLFWLAAAYLLVMVTMSAFQAVITAVMPDRVPAQRRGFVSAIASFALAVGVIYGLNVAPVFIATPVLAYLLIGALLIVGTLLLVFLAPDPTAKLDAEQNVAERQSIRHFFTALRDHDFAWAFWSRATIMIGYWTVSTYQLYTLTDYIGAKNLPGGNAATAVALLGTINLAVSVVASLVSGPLSDRLGRRKVFVIVASFGIAAGALIPAIWPTWTGMLAYSVVVGLFFGVYMAVDQAIMTLVLPDPENTARDLGLLNVATTGPQIAGPFLAALVILLTGGYAPLFIFTAVAAALAAFFIAPIRKVR